MTELLRIAVENNVIVEYADVPQNGSLSVHGRYADYVALDRVTCANSAEERTHAAHELGHCLLGAFYNVYSELDVREKHEYRANKWAVEHLIPRPALISAIKQGCREPWELAELFDVTEEMIKKAFSVYSSSGSFANA